MLDKVVTFFFYVNFLFLTNYLKNICKSIKFLKIKSDIFIENTINIRRCHKELTIITGVKIIREHNFKEKGSIREW